MGGSRLRGALRTAGFVAVCLALALTVIISGASAVASDQPALAKLLFSPSALPAGFSEVRASSGQITPHRLETVFGPSAPVSQLDGVVGYLQEWQAPDSQAVVVQMVVKLATPDHAAHTEQSATGDLAKQGLRGFAIPISGAVGQYGTTGSVTRAEINIAVGSVWTVVIAEHIRTSTVAPTIALDSRVARDVAKRIDLAYPGASASTLFDPVAVAFGVFAIPLVYLLLLDAFSWLRDPLRRSRRTAAATSGAWGVAHDVTSAAKRERRHARLLTWTQIVGASLIVDAVLPFSLGARFGFLAGGIVLVAGTAAIRAVRARGSHVRTLIRGKRPVRALGLSLLAVLTVLVAAFAAAFAAIDENEAPGGVKWEYCAVAGFMLAGLLQRRARRLSALTAVAVTKRDPRPVVLYLRAFQDDVVRLRTATLGRASLLERLSPGRFDTFEEVLVRHLSSTGPVIAVNPPGVRLPPIGAARETIPHEQWRTTVQQWMDQAALIVVAAPPGNPTPGVVWELVQLDHGSRWDRTLVVLPPVTPAETERRWSALVDAGPPHWPFRRPLPVSPADLLVLIRKSGTWVGFSAGTRTEWTYAAGLLEALASRRSVLRV